jgi:hypothetical protein
MGSFLFLKKWVLPFSADLKDHKKEILAESLCGITHGRPPLDKNGITTEIRPVTRLSITLCGQTLWRASAWLCITLRRQALLLHNMPLFMGGYTYTNGFSCRMMFNQRREKKKIFNNLFIVHPGVCCFYQLVDFIPIFSFLLFLFPCQYTHTHTEYS